MKLRRIRKKGAVYMGFGVLLLLLVVAYVLIHLTSPETATNINHALRDLSNSVAPIVPFK